MIKDVLYIPRIKCNLLSVGQLVEKSFSVVTKDGAFEMFNNRKKFILRSLLWKNSTFKTMISLSEVQCLKTDANHKNS